MSSYNNNLIVILGPTASGKTSMAVKLCEKFNGEIVSADSRQIYKNMDIGTNKELNLSIQQHMIDITEPDQIISMAEYKSQALKCIKKIQKQNKLPFLVGGTGLYISSIIDNLQIPKAKPNPILRQRLEKKSLKELQIMIKAMDPETAEIIQLKNKRRLIRALEVKLTTGKSFQSQKKKGQALFDILQIGIKTEKEKLYKKINKRVDFMLESGLIDEVESLLQKYSWDLPSMSGIGYKEIGQYLNHEITLAQAISLIKTHTRQYARRQMQWFKRDKRIKWIANYKEAEKLVKKFLKKDTAD